MVNDRMVRLRALRGLMSDGRALAAGTLFTLPAWAAIAAIDSGRAAPVDDAGAAEVEHARKAERDALLGRLQRESRALGR